MIYPNQAARDYEFRVVCDMTHNHAPHIRAMVGGAQFGIGFGGSEVITVQIVSVFDAFDPIGRWRARLWIGGVLEGDEDGSGWEDDLESRIELDGAVLTSDCDAWRLDADELRWYIKIGASAEVLVYTDTGPILFQGTGYDKRYNSMACEALAYLGTEDIRQAVLPHTPDFAPSEVSQILNAAKFGWRYDDGGWVEPTVAVDQTFNVPAVEDCDCEEPPGVIGTGDPPPTVWEVTLNTELLLDIERVDMGRYTCYCDPENPEIGTPAIRDVYRMEEEFVYLPIQARLYPADAGILRSTRVARARCSDPLNNPTYFEDPFTPWGPFTSIDPTTYIEYQKWAYHLTAIKHYGFLVQIGNCPVGVPDDPPLLPPDCAPSGEEICWYEAYIAHYHDKPPCDELTDSHMWRDSQGRLYTVMSGGAQIEVWRHRVNGEADTQIVADALGPAQGAWSPKGFHAVVYRGPDLDAPETTRLWRIQSLSHCTAGMWGEQLEIGAYTHFGFAIDPRTGIEYVIVHDTGTDPPHWHCYRRRPQDAAFADMGEIVNAEDGYMAGLEVDASSQHRLVATIKTDTALKRFYSQDGGRTWRD